MIFERDRLEVGRKRYSLQNATVFREEDHPRGEGGQFGTGGPPKSFNIDPKKVKENPIPKELKAKWAKSGGVDNPEYKKWIYAHWNALV